jgi:hypothetical protein
MEKRWKSGGKSGKSGDRILNYQALTTIRGAVLFTK